MRIPGDSWLDSRKLSSERRGVGRALARVARAGRCSPGSTSPTTVSSAGAAVMCPTMGLEAAYSARGDAPPGASVGRVRAGPRFGSTTRPREIRRARGPIPTWWRSGCAASRGAIEYARDARRDAGRRGGAADRRHTGRRRARARRAGGRPRAVGSVHHGAGVPAGADGPSRPSGATRRPSGGCSPRVRAGARRTAAQEDRSRHRASMFSAATVADLSPWRSAGATRAWPAGSWCWAGRGGGSAACSRSGLTLPHVEAAGRRAGSPLEDQPR